MQPGSIRIFRTQSPRHFEGGNWDQGGSCPRLKPLMSQEVDNLFKMYRWHLSEISRFWLQ